VRVGEVVGSYRITGKLGSGGMGAVYLAKHTLIGREAAIKVLLPELCGDESIVARFFNEARTTTAIKHPGIVEIYDFGYARDGSAYLVMERLEGEPLGARLKRVGRIPVDQALSIARQISGALMAAHRIGVVHRDLKPDNVYIVSDSEVQGGERAKILDFGIAKLRDKGESFSAFQTQEGTVMGAPTYMAPEQVAGADKVDHRADQYSVGCILFEMICGRPPFEGRAYGEVMAKQVREPPPWPSSIEPSVTPEVDALVLKMLEKRPEARFSDAYDLLQRLHELGGLPPPSFAGPLIVPPPPPTPEEVGSPFESHQALDPVDGLPLNITRSQVVSSARLTLALGPRSKGSQPPPIPPLPASKRTPPPPPGQRAKVELADTMPSPVPKALSDAAGNGALSSSPPPPMFSTPPSTMPPTMPKAIAPPPLEPPRRQTPSSAPPLSPLPSPMPDYGPPPLFQQPPLSPVPGPYMPDGPPYMQGGPPPHMQGGPPQMMRHGVPPISSNAPTLYDQPRPPPLDLGPRPPEREPSTLSSAAGAPMMMQPVAARRSGKLGALVVGIAIAAGGASAYFIATSDDLGGGDEEGGDKVASSETGDKQEAATTQPKVDEAATQTPGATAAADAAPSGSGAQPPGGQTAPPGGDKVPPGGETAPPGGQTAPPGGDKVPPGGDKVPPGGDKVSPPPDPKGAGGSGEDAETNRRPAALVTLQIDSLPRGAQVIRKGDNVRLGETPFTYQTEPQAGSVTFVLRHKGYRDEVVTVPANRSVDRKVPLTRSAGPDRAPSIHDP
jgi:serine/threonine-protein kinase